MHHPTGISMVILKIKWFIERLNLPSDNMRLIILGTPRWSPGKVAKPHGKIG
jgi:hypothetical protein